MYNNNNNMYIYLHVYVLYNYVFYLLSIIIIITQILEIQHILNVQFVVIQTYIDRGCLIPITKKCLYSQS